MAIINLPLIAPSFENWLILTFCINIKQERINGEIDIINSPLIRSWF